MSDYDFCTSCNQYGCHLITCEHAFDNRKVPVVQTAPEYVLELEAENVVLHEQLAQTVDLYKQARSDYEVMRMENFSLMSENRELTADIEKLKESLKIERDAANHWMKEANEEHNRAEKLEDKLYDAQREIEFYQDDRGQG